MESQVKVICRFRPFDDKEIGIGGLGPIHSVKDDKTVIIKEVKEVKGDALTNNFAFDRAFDMQSKQIQIFDYVGIPILDSIFEGFNGTILLYGQTASGKTHTMLGQGLGQNAGIAYRMIWQIFDRIRKCPDHIQFQIKVSVAQIYNEKVRDLIDLNKKELKIRQDFKKNVFIEDLTERYVVNQTETIQWLQEAIRNRITGVTNINQRSSRSHMIIMLALAQKNLKDKTAKTGKLFLGDLAGSERVSKTGAVGEQLKQAKKINSSLIVLGKVINSLIDKSIYVPYRESKLTRILQESLGGNSKTALIVTCSPHHLNIGETISTLRFGISARKVKNKVKQNKEYTIEELLLLLQKKEKQNQQKDKRIKRLQDYISNELNSKLPLMKYDEDECFVEQGKSMIGAIDENNNEQVKILHDQIAFYKENQHKLMAQYLTLQERNQLLQVHQEQHNQRIQELQLKLRTSGEIKVDAQMTGEACRRIQTLQQQVHEERIKSLTAEEKLSRVQKDIKKKLLILQGNIRTMTENYFQLAKVKSHWKTEFYLLEKKLQKKTLEYEQLILKYEELKDYEYLEDGLYIDDIKEDEKLSQGNFIKTVKGGGKY